MVKVTLDNGDVILLERFDSAVRDVVGVSGNDLKLSGIDSMGTYYKMHDQSSPQAIRTIEFLP